jgi:hypothetical protein
MLIGLFTQVNKGQDLFKDHFDPLFCIKEIKSKDTYLGYVSYSYYHFINHSQVDICDILKELCQKYTNRIEGYLFYWNLLRTEPFADPKQSFLISERLYKESISLKFDDQISL